MRPIWYLRVPVDRDLRGDANCNNNPDDGCETHLLIDPNNCTACGLTCSNNHISIPTCLGNCDGMCDPDWVDCNFNKQPDGCESLLVDYCGACTPGYKCSSVNIVRHCTSGVCDGTCNPGFADCDWDKMKNGCETNISDIYNCGPCGHECSQSTLAGVLCVAGKCTGTCKQGLADCNGDKDTDGCEVVIASDPDNCGGCAAPCSKNHVAFRACVNGACVGLCSDGFADCDDDKRSNGCEADVKAPGFCGSCGNAKCKAMNPDSRCSLASCVDGTGCLYSKGTTCGNGVCEFGEAQCPSYCPGCSSWPCPADCADSDEDGLPDTWELNGVDSNCDGIADLRLDLPPLNATVGKKDLFLEVDYMVAPGHFDKPKDSTIAELKALYASHDINLYVEVDEPLEHHQVVVIGPLSSYQQCNFPDAVNYYDLRMTHLAAARLPVFRYVVGAHSQTYQSCFPDVGGGLSVDQIGFIVSTGFTGFSNMIGEAPLTHELGHVLWLGHGGGDAIEWKPNYYSAMNVGGSGLVNQVKNDYSHHELPALDEISGLNESVGVQTPEAANVVYSCPVQCVAPIFCKPSVGCQQGSCPNNTQCRCQLLWSAPGVIGTDPIDWECNGAAGDQPNVKSAVTYTTVGAETQLQVLYGHDDWSNLRYSFCGQGYQKFSAAPQIPDDMGILTPAALRASALPLQVELQLDPESIALGTAGLVRVVVLATPSLEAASIDAGSITFARSAPESTETDDVNNDGRADLVGYFDILGLYLVPASQRGMLTGTLKSGLPIYGEHPLTALPPPSPLVPLARCSSPIVAAGDGCVASASINAGSHDQAGDPLVITQTPPGPYSLGSTAVVLTATDGAHASQCQASVTVVDRSPPRLKCPQHQERECDPTAAALVFAPTASDNCALANLSCEPAASPSWPPGYRTVLCTALDVASNRSACEFAVEVVDSEGPTATPKGPVFLFVKDSPIRDMYVNLQGHDKQTFAYPFQLHECVASVVDRCFGPLPVEGSARLTRIEWWPRSPSGKPQAGKSNGVLHSRLTHFANHGCEQFAISGSTAASLPVVGLEDDGGSYYLVHFAVNDPFGNTTEAVCQVDLLGTQANWGVPVGPGLGCGVCVGQGCGSCPSPAQVCQ